MQEEWKSLISYNNLVEVSNFGNVRKLGKKTLLKPKLDKSGYLYVHIRISNLGINKMAKIHRLVAEAFIPNPNKYPIINENLSDDFLRAAIQDLKKALFYINDKIDMLENEYKSFNKH